MIWLKRIAILFLLLLLIAFGFIQYKMYEAKNGFAKYETTPHQVDIPEDKISILILSKTTAYRHSKAMPAFNRMMHGLAEKNDWFVYETEDAGIINADQLPQFEIIIWNNSTGPVLNEEQRTLVAAFVERGGTFLGIHGAGDDSHKWPWYIKNVIGTEFSHHPIKNHIQEAEVKVPLAQQDSTWQLTPLWTHADEWYIFKSHPKAKEFNILYEIDGTKIDPNGNLLWFRGMDFGMGINHPIAWNKKVKEGHTFYTSMGHTPETYSNPNFVSLIEQAIWVGAK